MRVKNTVKAIMGALVALAVISCVTAPAVATLDDATKQAYSGAQDRMGESRQKAMDFESATYAPDEWNGTESLYNVAKNAPLVTMPDYEAAIQQLLATWNY